jgi:gamma-glutamyl:cysteine ligase YbdK (ATP-grasp superfamily)
LKVGTEHEYSVNDGELRPMPIVDELIREITGSVQNDASFDGVEIGKELQKHVMEFRTPEPMDSLPATESILIKGLRGFAERFGGAYRLLGLGMHPLMRPDQTSVWDHEEREIYEAYDRLFDLRQHGWVNIQALQINIPYRNEKELVALFNRIRALIPYLVALTAASPVVEGRLTRHMDNRLRYYRENQRQMPLICNGVIPERLDSLQDYVGIQEEIYGWLRDRDAEVLCAEWVNSRGVIVRFNRRCLELKALDEQECLRSDIAVTAFLHSLLRSSDLDPEEDEGILRDLLEHAIEGGTAGLREELLRLHTLAEASATNEELAYLPVVKRRIENGSVAELMTERLRDGEDVMALLWQMERCLMTNIPFR